MQKLAVLLRPVGSVTSTGNWTRSISDRGPSPTRPGPLGSRARANSSVSPRTTTASAATGSQSLAKDRQRCLDMKKVKAVARLSPDLDGPSLRPGRPGDRRGTAPKDGRIAGGGGRAHELRRILNRRSSADTLAGIAPDSRIRLKRRRGKCQGASPTTEQETSKQCDHLLSFSTHR